MFVSPEEKASMEALHADDVQECDLPFVALCNPAFGSLSLVVWVVLRERVRVEIPETDRGSLTCTPYPISENVLQASFRHVVYPSS